MRRRYALSILVVIAGHELTHQFQVVCAWSLWSRTMEQELLGILLSAAISLSGLPAVDIGEVPPILRMSHADITREVCPLDPQSCRGLVAMYDRERQRILIDDSLNMEVVEDNSFVVHELVHVLQYKQRGDQMYDDCVVSIATETQAYQVQNAYLRREGRLHRFAQQLAFAGCTSAIVVF